METFINIHVDFEAPSEVGGRTPSIKLFEGYAGNRDFQIEFDPPLPDAFAPVLSVEDGNLMLELMQLDGGEPINPFPDGCEVRVIAQ
jgi:hypothetical protein